MKKYEEIKQIIENNQGIMTSKFFKDNNISNYYIKKMINDNIIERNSRGIYIRCDIFEDEFYILQQKSRKIVFSYNTAMYFLGETERTPEVIDVTAYKGFNAHRLQKNVRVHYVRKENLYLGAIKVKTPGGFEVTSYNLERILCDLIRGKDTGVDKEQTNKFIKEMFLKNKIDSNVVIEYSKKLKCEKKVREVMEVFI